MVPNQHGLPVDSNHELSIAAYVQPSDYLLLSAGAVSYSGRTTPTGSMLSVGTNWAQLDLGYRDHWLSPMTDSSSLDVSTEDAHHAVRDALELTNRLTRSGVSVRTLPGRKCPSNHDFCINGVASLRRLPDLFGVQISIEPFPRLVVRSVNQHVRNIGGAMDCPRRPTFLLTRLFQAERAVAERKATNKRPMSAAVIIPDKNAIRRVFSNTPARTTRMAAAICWAIRWTSAGIDFSADSSLFRCHL